MQLKAITSRLLASAAGGAYRALDGLYTRLDRRHIKRTRNIRLIPSAGRRMGGKFSYAEWAHVIGIFQTLIYEQLPGKEGNTILDVGCGAGLVAMAACPFVDGGGRYVGIDVMARNVEFCREHYPADCCEFIHCDASNPMYAPDQKTDGTPWPIEDDSVDLMTGLSVWTHLNEADSRYYLKEVGRVLKPGARAIITFFVLDGLYRDSLPHRSGRPGRYHDTPQDHWIFDQPTYGSRDWLHPAWTKVPEQAIGVTEQAMAQLLEDSGLRQVRMYPGNWKEVPGLYFQDVLVLQKGRRDAGND